MEKSLISIIVPVCALNKRLVELTDDCLRALVASTKQPYEIIVVDNGSPEPIDWAQGRKQIKVWRHVELQGNPGGWNRGLEVAKGDILVVCDNDTMAPANWETMLKRLEDPMVGCVIPIDGNNPTNEVTGFFIAFTREIYEMIGGFDERFNPAFFEDNDFLLRVAKAGFARAWAKDVVMVHQNQGSNTVMKSLDLSEAYKASRVAYMQKWGYTEDTIGLDMPGAV